MKERILNIETVHQCNCCLGCKTLHPLVSVIDLSKSNLEQQIIKFDFYTILMMEGEIDDVLYGRKYYDYSNASLVFLTPGESIKINKSKALPSKGWLLAFHPDLISQTSLGEHIKDYSFFFTIRRRHSTYLNGRRPRLQNAYATSKRNFVMR